MKKRTLPLSQVYRYLEPGPVVLVSTAYKDKQDIMTMSWHTMIDFEPPLIGCVISNRNNSFNYLKKSKECVINIPTVELAKTVVACGNTSGRNIDKFAHFDLATTPGSQVDVPLIDDCFVNLECKVKDARLADKYNFFILEVLKAWISPSKRQQRTLHHQGKGIFVIDGQRIKLPSKMK